MSVIKEKVSQTFVENLLNSNPFLERVRLCLKEADKKGVETAFNVEKIIGSEAAIFPEKILRGDSNSTFSEERKEKENLFLSKLSEKYFDNPLKYFSERKEYMDNEGCEMDFFKGSRIYGKPSFIPPKKLDEFSFWKIYPKNYFPSYTLIRFHTHPGGMLLPSKADLLNLEDSVDLRYVNKNLKFENSLGNEKPIDFEKHLKLRKSKPLMIIGGDKLLSITQPRIFSSSKRKKYIEEEHQKHFSGDFLLKLLFKKNYKNPLNNFYKRTPGVLKDSKFCFLGKLPDFSFSAGKLVDYETFLENYWKTINDDLKELDI